MAAVNEDLLMYRYENFMASSVSYGLIKVLFKVFLR